ncbi:MAG: HAD family hydrolase [bacterium]|nr:HAD family hydrolase [bacterium]
MAQLYISDLDGTLLQNDATLSPFARQQLTRLIEADVQITFATARSVVSASQILQGVPFRLPAICVNGTYISDFHTHKHLILNTIPDTITSGIFECIRSHNLLPFITTFNGIKECLNYSHTENEGMDWYVQDRIRAQDHRLQQVNNLENALSERVIAFTTIHKLPQLQVLERNLNNQFGSQIEIYFFENAYSPEWYWLCIHDKNGTKARGIQAFLQHFDFALEDVTVFGDNLNDLPMFELVPRAIAVENAIPELKSLSAQIIGPNTADSVVRFILRENGLD